MAAVTPETLAKLARLDILKEKLEIDLLEFFMSYRHLPGEPSSMTEALRAIEGAARRARERAEKT